MLIEHQLSSISSSVVLGSVSAPTSAPFTNSAPGLRFSLGNLGLFAALANFTVDERSGQQLAYLMQERDLRQDKLRSFRDGRLRQAPHLAVPGFQTGILCMFAGAMG